MDDVLHPSVLHKCASDFVAHVVGASHSVSCAVCDLLYTKRDCMWVTAENLPNKELLTSNKILTDCDALKPLFFNYPSDDTNFLDGLVLAREGFEEEDPHRMRVCSTCLNDMRKNKLPKAAKANGFVLGDFPEELQTASWVEMIAASPVRMSGTVLALEEFKIGQVPGSHSTCKTRMRSDRTFLHAPQTSPVPSRVLWLVASPHLNNFGVSSGHDDRWCAHFLIFNSTEVIDWRGFTNWPGMLRHQKTIFAHTLKTGPSQRQSRNLSFPSLIGLIPLPTLARLTHTVIASQRRPLRGMAWTLSKTAPLPHLSLRPTPSCQAAATWLT
ncbi:unnamed protein product [Ascophyllum nodosum]